ncbi:MAG: hypothetical protein AB7E96_01235 [Deferribacterales bacterium]
MKKIFFHIGYPKTGTSSLQFFLIFNRHLLKNTDVYYEVYGCESFFEMIEKIYRDDQTVYPESGILPDIYESDVEESPESPFHNFLCFVDFELALEYIKKAISNFERSGCSAMVFCSELFTLNFTPSQIKRILELFKGYDFRVVCYIREPFSFIKSCFYQEYKWPNYPRNDIYDFCISQKHYLLDIVMLFMQNWVHVVGKEKVSARFFNRDFLKNGDVVADFADIVGCDTSELKQVREVNVKMFSGALPLFEALYAHFPELRVKTADELFRTRQCSITIPVLQASQAYYSGDMAACTAYLDAIKDNIISSPVISKHKDEMLAALDEVRSNFLNRTEIDVFKDAGFSRQVISCYKASWAELADRFFDLDASAVFMKKAYKIFNDEYLKCVSPLKDIVSEYELEYDFFQWWCLHGDKDWDIKGDIAGYLTDKLHNINTQSLLCPTELMLSLWEITPDLRQQFSDPKDKDSVEYWKWWLSNAGNKVGIINPFPLSLVDGSMDADSRNEFLQGTSMHLSGGEDVSVWWSSAGIKKYYLDNVSTVVLSKLHRVSPDNFSGLELTALMRLFYDYGCLNGRFGSLDTDAAGLVEFWKYWISVSKNELGMKEYFPCDFIFAKNTDMLMRHLMSLFWNNRKDLQDAMPEPGLKYNDLISWWRHEFEYMTL